MTEVAQQDVMPKTADSKPARVPVVFEQKGGLVPTTFDEAYRMATAFAGSGMVPKAYADKPEAVFVAMQMGAELGIPPLQAVQNIAVINGKPGVYGDMGKALLLAAGCAIDEDDTEVIQKNGRARCKITRPGRQPVERTFSIENAKTAGLWGKDGPWKTYPFRQMAWRAFWFAARDGAADLLKGMRGAEELVDYPPEREVTGTAEFVEQPKRVEKPAEPSSAPQGNAGGTESQTTAAGTASSAVSSPAVAEHPTTPAASTQTSSPDTAGQDAASQAPGKNSTTQTSTPKKAQFGPDLGLDDGPPPIDGESEREPEPTTIVDDGGPRLQEQQIKILLKRMEGAALTIVDFRAKFRKEHLEEMPAASFNSLISWIKNPF